MKSSVLITCYRRRAFLKLAVASVVADGADEVVVVKDWTDPETDAWLQERGVKVVTEDIPVVGEMMARGLAECTGESVSFLDDDDMFAPGKVAAVRQAFEDDPELLLFRTGWTEVDVDGAPYPDRHLAQPDRVHSFRTTDIDAGVFRWIVENRSYGTLSTQSVRRRALEAKVADLRHVECVTDVSMALLMMSEPGRHRFDPRPLTIRRIGSGRRYAHPVHSGAHRRTFTALRNGATSPAARQYAEMNLRWGRLEILLGGPRLALLEKWTDLVRHQRHRIDAVVVKQSLKTAVRFVFPLTVEKVTNPPRTRASPPVGP
jgi:hypothetical protein